MSLMHYKYTNLVDAGTIYRYSSQLDGLPASNIQNGLKLRVWRTDSGFTINGRNNVLPFEDTAGVTVTATITTGTYSDASSLASVVASAMDSVGTYTGHGVTYNSSDGKFRLTKAASASILSLLFSKSSYNAAIPLGFTWATDYTGSTGYTSAMALAGDNEVIVEFDSTTSVDCMIIDGHNLATGTVMRYRLGNSATAFPAGLSNGGSGVVRSATVTITEDIVSIEHTSTSAKAMQLFWYDRSQAYSEIGRLWAGTYFEPSYHSTGEDRTWVRKRLRERSKQVVSEGGATLIDKRDAVTEYTISPDSLDPHFNNATKSGFETMFDMVGDHQAFYISFSDDLENDTVYGIITGDVEYRRLKNTAVLQVKQFVFREQK